MKDLKDSGLITQLVVVATMMPKVKQYIDELIDENKELRMKLINALFEIEYAKRSDEWINAK